MRVRINREQDAPNKSNETVKLGDYCSNIIIIINNQPFFSLAAIECIFMIGMRKLRAGPTDISVGPTRYRPLAVG